MIPDTLSTNQIKNAAGNEVEFTRLVSGIAETVFAQVNEPPALEHRLKVAHQTFGTGFSRRRRSVTRITKKVVSDVDPTKTVEVLAYEVIDIPIGALTTYVEPKNVQAELMSFLASTGADTTIKFDCTGTGAAAMIDGSL